MVLLVHEFPSGEVRAVPKEFTVTKSPFPKVTPFRLYMVPEVLLVQEVPSGEVMMVPEFPTPTNNTLEVVVELSVVVGVDLLLLQEMTVKLKRNKEKRMSRCFTWFPIRWFRRTQYIPSIGLFYKKWGGFRREH